MAIMAMRSKVLVTLTILALLLGKFQRAWDRVVIGVGAITCGVR